jgi:hypothetical protein
LNIVGNATDELKLFAILAPATLQVGEIPETGSAALMGMGLAAFAARRRAKAEAKS